MRLFCPVFCVVMATAAQGMETERTEQISVSSDNNKVTFSVFELICEEDSCSLNRVTKKTIIFSVGSRNHKSIVIENMNLSDGDHDKISSACYKILIDVWREKFKLYLPEPAPKATFANWQACVNKFYEISSYEGSSRVTIITQWHCKEEIPVKIENFLWRNFIKPIITPMLLLKGAASSIDVLPFEIKRKIIDKMVFMFLMPPQF